MNNNTTTMMTGATNNPNNDNNTNNTLLSTTNNASDNISARLPSEKGFSSSILASNFSAPHNILYGPDGLLWITERIGKNITLVDPTLMY